MDLRGKTVAIGVTGSIAAYRACDLIRELYRRGAARVIPLMTESAKEFITPLTLKALSQQPVYSSELEVDPLGMPIHIVLAQQADILVIMPATANTIANLAHGIADDLVSTTAITFTGKPVLIAPAMNTRMWQNPLTRRNLAILREVGNLTIVEPSSGLLACGETGDGHLADQETILREIYRLVHPQRNRLSGLRALVTAGGTAEPIDPVRVITNRSSGKMGIALADELYAMGASVTVVTSVAGLNRPYEVVLVDTADEMRVEIENRFEDTELLLMAAAVSDYAMSQPAKQKIKKDYEAGKEKPLSIELTHNMDILARLGELKQPNQTLVGFAAESHDVEKYAQQKLARKNLDVIVANDISRKDIGFAADENEVMLIFKDGDAVQLPKAPKQEIAREILNHLYDYRLQDYLPRYTPEDPVQYY